MLTRISLSSLPPLLVWGLLLFLVSNCAGPRFSPSEPGVWYEYRQGDSLEKIAEQYGVDAFKIRKRNEIYEPEDLAAGMLLFIPGAQSAPGAPGAPAFSPPSGEVEFPELKPSDPIGRSGKRFVWPAKGVISSGYGRRHGRMHHGIDITKDNGYEILAAATGSVEFAGKMSGYGNVLILNHGRGIKTLYAHNARHYVRQGQRVRQGQKIAKIGSTGRSSGPHLHFEIRVNDKAQNPLRYLPIR